MRLRWRARRGADELTAIGRTLSWLWYQLNRQPGASIMLLFGAANVGGAFVVFLYLTVTGQGSLPDVRSDVLRGALLLLAYLFVTGVITTVAGIRSFDLGWIDDERRPSPAEARSTLGLPAHFARLSFAAWCGGALLFSIVGTTIGGDGLGDTLRTAVGVLLAGCTTAATCYLVIERQLRPTFALVLAGATDIPTTTVGVRPRIMLAWVLGSGVPLLGVAMAPTRPDESLYSLAVLAVIGLVSGATLLSVATRTVSDRLASVREALAKIQAGDLAVEVQVDEAGEVGTLQAGVNAMVRGLRERQVLQDLFGRHVGEEVARHALEEGVHLGGEVRDVSVLFVDVAGSTWLAATRPPTEVVAMLNDLFRTVVDLVGQEGGWVDKFEGDAAICVFGAPNDQPDHAAAALRSARRVAAELARLQRRHPDLDIGIGVSSGPAVAGNIGSETRFEYTVIGDPVNEAARLTEAAKARPSRVVAAKRAVEAAGDEARHWRPGEVIALRGRPLPTETFEPMDIEVVSGKDMARRVSQVEGTP